MSRVVWTEPALKDMEGIRAYIARDSESYANALVLEIVEAVERLARFPRLGRPVTSPCLQSNRRLVSYSPYRLGSGGTCQEVLAFNADEPHLATDSAEV